MRQIFLLSKQNLVLSKQELLSLVHNKNHELIDNLLIIDTSFKDYSRLAYTKSVYNLLFIAYKHNLEQKMQNFNWQSIYKKNFCLRTFNSNLSQAELAGHIWNSVKQPKVDLTNPKTEIHLIKKGSKFLCCLLKEKLKQPFEQRKAHLRPALHPTSTHPRLARAMLNLTGIQPGQTLLDPFCGSGGILIEAGLIGCNTIGYDINPALLKKAEKNLNYYKIKNYKLQQRNALTIKKKFNFIVTDLPYGLNTPSTNLKQLYTTFLKTLEKILAKKAVIIFPNFINYKKLLNQTKLKIKQEFDYYIHKNLTKKITVLTT